MIGKTVSHYRILEKIGGGGMGVVYKAKDEKLDRTVALKFLPSHLLEDKEAEQRFMSEAKSASSLDHPNICTIYDINKTDDGQMFIAMAYYDGETLKKKIKSGNITAENAVDIAAQIASGLMRAHQKAIIHRDIKPANIMITNHNEVKILDFGLAKSKGANDLTKLGSTIGTTAYMSPEQARGENVDHRTDIWALGVILYEMITGKAPFKGEYEQAIIYSILNEEPQKSEGVDERIWNIISKAISKGTSSRYQTINEMYSDLNEIRTGSGSKSGISNYSAKPTGNLLKGKSKLVLSISAIFVTIVLILYFLVINKSTESVEITGKKMIVVLPFKNLGSQDENYFAEGITDELTSKLSSIGEINVIATQSAQKLAESGKSPYEIGKELGVDYVLQGTVRWAKIGGNENRVRITPQLIRMKDNIISWSDSYDKVLNDIFSVQNEIAQKVVNQLSGSLVSNQLEKDVPPTDNLDAYDYFLQGLAYENRGGYTKSDIQNSISLYEKATDLDPKFALAYANLSINKSGMYWFFYDRSDKTVKEALELANKAFQLNPDLAEVHLAYGYYYYWCELNYPEAIKEFSEVLKIQPNSSEAYFGIGVVYRRMGNFNLSLQNQIKAYSLDPISFELGRNIAETYGLVRDYKNADKYYKRVIELNPDRSFPKVDIAQILISWKGDIKTAMEILEKINVHDYLDVMQNVAVFVDILNRNYNKAILELNSLNKEYESSQFRFTPKSLMLALIYTYKNNQELAKTYFDSSRVQIEGMLNNKPRDERLHSALGVVYAGLENKEKALAEGRKGIELLPIEKEAYRGYYREWDMAIIYTLLGDYDKALEKIDFILSIPGAFSVNVLKLDPLYDPLRNLSEYKAIITKYSSN